MTLVMKRPTVLTNSVFGRGGTPGTTLNAGDQIFGTHPAANTYAGTDLYTLIYIQNTSVGTTYTNLKIVPTVVGTARSTITIALSSVAAAASPNETSIANPSVSPGLTFASSVTIPTLLPGFAKGIWLKRDPVAYTTLTATDGINADGDVRLTITGSY